ncbi:MAG: PDZ domain-containing protein, partial [Planctomycetes bacterium]|nr:PDZ domain-containing protein [Planctomycetota bacterium]
MITRIRPIRWLALAALAIGATTLPRVASAQAIAVEATPGRPVLVAADDHASQFEKEIAAAIHQVVEKYKQQLADQRARSERRIAELEEQTARLRAQIEELRRGLAQRHEEDEDEDDDDDAAPAAGRPFLGVALAPAAPEQLSALGIERGVLVNRVVPETPAARVGLKSGDVVTSLRGKAVDFETFTDVIAGAKIGDRVAIEYSRLVDGKPVRFEGQVKLAARDSFDLTQMTPGAAEPSEPRPPVEPKPAPAAQSEPVRLGARVREEAESRLIIVEVTAGSNSAEAGLREGDRLIAVGGRDVATLENVKDALTHLKAGDEKGLTFERDGQIRTVRLRWGAGEIEPSVLGTKSETGSARRAPERTEKTPGYLGVSIDTEGGVLRIDEVLSGSPAEKMGLQSGDRIVSVNGTEVNSLEQLGQLFGGLYAGDAVTVRVQRGDDHYTIKGTLGGRDTPPSTAAVSTERPYVGVEVRELGRNLEIAEVFEGSAAARAGVAQGDQLVAIAGRLVERLEGVRAALDSCKPGETVETQVLR